MTAPRHRVVYDGPGDVWFFAYGSLMWDAPFPVAETRPALLRGYHRAFCLSSVIYRGTPDRPGLSLGLDFGGACQGRVLRVRAAERDATARYLEDRELREDIYFCRRVPVTTPGGRLHAYAFVINRADPLYVKRLDIGRTARRIAGASGQRGSNRTYLENTVRHLDALGIADESLRKLLREVEKISGPGQSGE